VRVGDLAETACLSSRQFDRVFKEYTGIGTKEFLRIVRLQHVFHRAYNSDNENLTAIAHACGYYDQAHFNHEFREYTGSNPSHTLTTCSTQSDFFLQV
jgi:transcriptional regulator GlxA family with amidase domain